MLALTVGETRPKLLVSSRNRSAKMPGVGEDQATGKTGEPCQNIPERVPVMAVKIRKMQRAGEKPVNLLLRSDACEVDENLRGALRTGIGICVTHFLGGAQEAGRAPLYLASISKARCWSWVETRKHRRPLKGDDESGNARAPGRGTEARAGLPALRRVADSFFDRLTAHLRKAEGSVGVHPR